MNVRHSVGIAVAALAALVGGCGGQGGGAVDPGDLVTDPSLQGMPSLWTEYPSVSYRESGSLLYLAAAPFADTVRACSASARSEKVLARPALQTVIEFRRTGDSLRLLQWTEALGLAPYGITYVDPETVVKWFTVYVREGAGVSLEGTWRYVKLQYQHTSGLLTPEEQEVIDGRSWPWDTSTAGPGTYGMRVVFAGGTVRVRKLVPSTADILYSNPYATFDTTGYDLEVSRDSVGVITAIGKKSDDTVTVAIAGDGSIFYTCTRAHYSDYTYHADYPGCPNEPFPEWFSDFLAANRNASTLGHATGR